MALTIYATVGDGVTVTFPLSFPLGILKRDYVTCQVNNEVDGLGDPVYRTLTWINDGLVTIGGSVPGAGQSIVFRRTIPVTSLIHDYENGAAIEEKNLDESNKQAIMLMQQALDGRFDSFAQDVDAGGYGIKNAADAVDPQDLVTLTQLEDMTGNAPAYAASAASSASLAAASAITAGNHATNAGVAKTAAESARDAALAAVGSVKISATDTTATVLDSALLVGGLAVKTINNPAGNETLTVSVPVASTAEAQAGTLNTVAMTPVRVKEALDAQRKGIIQTVVGTYTANASLSTLIPLDDTIPQNTEGTEILNISFTPTRTDSKIRIRFIGDASADALAVIAAALFKDSGADALAACGMHVPAANYKSRLELFYEETSGSLTARNYKIRAGANSGAMRFNGSTGGRHYGGTSKTYIIIEEHVA